MKKLTMLRDDELMHEAKELGAPLELIRQIAKTGKLPVPNFSAGGIATTCGRGARFGNWVRRPFSCGSRFQVR